MFLIKTQEGTTVKKQIQEIRQYLQIKVKIEKNISLTNFFIKLFEKHFQNSFKNFDAEQPYLF